MADEIQVIPVDIMLRTCDVAINGIYSQIGTTNPDNFVMFVERQVVALYITGTSSGLISKDENGWTVDIGFYPYNQAEVIKLADDLLFKVNKILSIYDYQDSENKLPRNPMIVAMKDMLVKILEYRQVLTTATVTFTIPNMINHAEKVVG